MALLFGGTKCFRCTGTFYAHVVLTITPNTRSWGEALRLLDCSHTEVQFAVLLDDVLVRIVPVLGIRYSVRTVVFVR